MGPVREFGFEMLDYALGAIIEGSTAVLAASVLLQIDGEAMGSFLDAVSEDWPTFWRPFTLGSCGALLLRGEHRELRLGRLALGRTQLSTEMLQGPTPGLGRLLGVALEIWDTKRDGSGRIACELRDDHAPRTHCPRQLARVAPRGEHRRQALVGGHPAVLEALAPARQLRGRSLDLVLGASAPLPLVEGQLLRLGAPGLLSLQLRE